MVTRGNWHITQNLLFIFGRGRSINFFKSLVNDSGLHRHTIDLIFLDIAMPNISGVQFVKLIGDKPSLFLQLQISNMQCKVSN